jgi:diadenosine tetraphosphatase ApaH/serine/threonine PP2A family protein phosphatase
VVAAFDGAAFGAHLPAEVCEITAWTVRQLNRAQRDVLAAWPDTVALSVDGLGVVLFCYGSPRSDEEILTAATPEPRLRAALSGVARRVVVCGHTHMQFDRTLDGVRVLNAGSVGMPYGESGAYWLLLGPDPSIPWWANGRAEAHALRSGGGGRGQSRQWLSAGRGLRRQQRAPAAHSCRGNRGLRAHGGRARGMISATAVVSCLMVIRNTRSRAASLPEPAHKPAVQAERTRGL